MKLKLLFLLIFLNTKPVQSNLTTGFDLLYNFQLDKLDQFADTSSSPVIKNFFKSYSNLWKYLGSGKNEYLSKYKKYDSFFAEIDDSNSDLSDEETLFLNGHIYMNRALVNSFDKEMLKAFSNINKAVNNFEDCLEIDSNYNDAYINLAAIKYSLGFTPGFYGTLLKIFGLKSSLNETLKFLEKATQNSKHNNQFAYYYLSKLYIDEFNDVEKAGYYISQIENFTNPLFQYQKAVVDFKSGNYEKSLRLLNEILALKKDYFRQIKAVSHFLKGEIFFETGQFENAEKEYLEFINQTTKLDYIAFARLKAGLAAFNMGEINKADRHFSFIKLGDDNVTEDKFAYNFYDNYQNSGDNGKRKLIFSYNAIQLFFKKDSKQLLEIINKNSYLLNADEKIIFSIAAGIFQNNSSNSFSKLTKIEPDKLSPETKLLFNYLQILLKKNRLKIEEITDLLDDSIDLADDLNDYRFLPELKKISFENK